jgi:hypothetical protein
MKNRRRRALSSKKLHSEATHSQEEYNATFDSPSDFHSHFSQTPRANVSLGAKVESKQQKRTLVDNRLCKVSARFFHSFEAKINCASDHGKKERKPFGSNSNERISSDEVFEDVDE